MDYRHVRPVAESHLVEWDLRAMPGLTDPAPRTTFGSVALHPDVVVWLDEHAPGWEFSSDWDHGNAGDDDEGCHLSMPSKAAAEAFIAHATAVSHAWVAADRESMPFRAFLALLGRDEVEIARAHTPHRIQWEVEAALNGRAVSSDRRTAILTATKTAVAARQMAETGDTERRIPLEFADSLRVPGAVVLRMAVAELAAAA